MLDDGIRGPLPHDPDDIDARGPTARQVRVGRAPRMGDTPEPVALTRVHGLEGVTEPISAARLDLDDHQVPTVDRDDVHLAEPAPPVAVKDLIAVPHQVCDGAFLTGSSPFVFGCHADKRGRPGGRGQRGRGQMWTTGAERTRCRR